MQHANRSDKLTIVIGIDVAPSGSNFKPDVVDFAKRKRHTSQTGTILLECVH